MKKQIINEKLNILKKIFNFLKNILKRKDNNLLSIPQDSHLNQYNNLKNDIIDKDNISNSFINGEGSKEAVSFQDKFKNESSYKNVKVSLKSERERYKELYKALINGKVSIDSLPIRDVYVINCLLHEEIEILNKEIECQKAIQRNKKKFKEES